MRALLAVDQGTTGSRAILFDRRARIIDQAYREFPQYFPRPGWVEHDANEIWESVDAVMQQVLSRNRSVTVLAIGITNQRETTLVWDAKTSLPASRGIVWQCRRTTERTEALRSNSRLAAKIRNRTGLPLDPYFSGSKLEWLLTHLPLVRKLAAAGRLRFGTPDTWLVWKLTGGASHVTDPTNASRTMLFDIEKKCWDRSLLALFQIPETCLPAVRPSSGIFGTTVARGHLRAGIPIAGIAGDQQAALFGQTCFAPGSVKNTFGTGGFMLLNCGQRRIHSQHGLITTLGCDRAGRPAYVLEGAIFIAGAAMQWLRDELAILPRVADSETLAQSLPDNQGVYLVPAFVGLGAPYWDPHARGAFLGLTRGSGRAHLVRAALEAMAYSTRDVQLAMQEDSGLPLRALQVDGGAVRNNFLCQFLADVCRVRIRRPAITELTALGAAFLAGLAVGFWRDASELAALWSLDQEFVPRLPAAHARAWYAGWQDAVRKVRA
jgi:glycerol kinase